MDWDRLSVLALTIAWKKAFVSSTVSRPNNSARKTPRSRVILCPMAPSQLYCALSLRYCGASRGQGDGEAPNRFKTFAVMRWMRGSTTFARSSPQLQLTVPAPNTHAPLGAW